MEYSSNVEVQEGLLNSRKMERNLTVFGNNETLQDQVGQKAAPGRDADVF